MQTQAIIFDKKYYDSTKAQSWLKKHKYSPIKVHTTEEYIRFRIREPIKYKRFITKDIKKGIKMIIGLTK